MIARDKEIVKVVLLLTGSIEGTKESVLEYISSFDKYKFLWQKDLATEYAAFMSTSPSLEVCYTQAAYCNNELESEQIVRSCWSTCLLLQAYAWGSVIHLKATTAGLPADLGLQAHYLVNLCYD